MQSHMFPSVVVAACDCGLFVHQTGRGSHAACSLLIVLSDWVFPFLFSAKLVVVFKFTLSSFIVILR